MTYNKIQMESVCRFLIQSSGTNGEKLTIFLANTIFWKLSIFLILLSVKEKLMENYCF